MTQVFDTEGRVTPVTVLSAGPVTVTQVKGKEKDGYTAIQVGFGDKAAKNISKPLAGHLKGKTFRHLKEFRTDASMNVGDSVNASAFEVGDLVEVSAISKGKGFQGVVKRHGFKGGPRSHGQKHSERAPGSIGAVWPQRVLKGKRMAGRMGGDRITVKNLKVVAVDQETNTLMISGAIPGRRGTLVEVRGK